MALSFAFAGDLAVGEVLSRRMEEAGFVLASGVDSADCVCTYCLSQSTLEDAYLGTGGIIENAREGCVLVDLSPSTATMARELYALARVNEMQFIDAPLVLKDLCAHDAFGDRDNILILAGGEDEAFRIVEPLLRAIAGDVRLIGLAGAGQLGKAACTLQQVPQLVSLVEAHALSRGEDGGEEAHRSALQAAVDARIITPETARLYDAIATEHFQGTHTCAVLMAEVSAVIAGAEESQVVLPQTESCQRLLELFLVVGGAQLPGAALSLSYAEEETCAAYGIDWSRAEGLYDHEHEHDLERFDEDEDDAYRFAFDDDEEDYAGYGGFSSN